MSGTRKLLVKAVLLVAVFGLALALGRMKRDELIREGSHFLQGLASRESKIDVRVGKISGKLSGVIRFEDVRLEDPNLPAGMRVIFRAKRVEFRYRLWEFLTKNFRAKVAVDVKDPEFYWRPSVRLRSDPFPFFSWLRDLVLTQRQRLSLRISNLTVFAGVDKQPFGGISLVYEDDHFDVLVPLHHFQLLGNDMSTEVRLDGRLEWGLLKAEDRVTGQLWTEASVVNWQPLPSESRLDFTLTRGGMTVLSSDVLGGLELIGELRLEGEGEADLKLTARDYPIQNFQPFFSRGEQGSYDGHLTLDASFNGPLEALKTEADARIAGGKMGDQHYRTMVLHVTGVYPTLTLSDSHLLMEDGAQMKFAEKDVEFNDLFSMRTYRSLVLGTSQDSVTFGDWGFRRPFDENQNPEFLMERSLGKHGAVQFRKYNETEPERKVLEPVGEAEKQDVEVGFHYKLRGDDTIKYTVREDEQFVGVERKMSF